MSGPDFPWVTGAEEDLNVKLHHDIYPGIDLRNPELKEAASGKVVLITGVPALEALQFHRCSCCQ